MLSVNLFSHRDLLWLTKNTETRTKNTPIHWTILSLSSNQTPPVRRANTGVRKAREALNKTGIEDKTFLRMSAIISSMTKQEKGNPSIINGSRKKRIALGSGVQIQDVNKLLKQFKNMQLMMKKISKHGVDGMQRMLSNNLGTNNLGNMLNNLRRK